MKNSANSSAGTTSMGIIFLRIAQVPKGLGPYLEIVSLSAVLLVVFSNL